jgi:hypothetical protein
MQKIESFPVIFAYRCSSVTSHHGKRGASMAAEIFVFAQRFSSEWTQSQNGM